MEQQTQQQDDDQLQAPAAEFVGMEEIDGEMFAVYDGVQF